MQQRLCYICYKMPDSLQASVACLSLETPIEQIVPLLSLHNFIYRLQEGKWKLLCGKQRASRASVTT